MKKKRPFKILIIEDDENAVLPLLNSGNHDARNAYYFLTAVKNIYLSLKPDERANLEIYWSQSTDFTQKINEQVGSTIKTVTKRNAIFCLFPVGSMNGIETAIFRFNGQRPINIQIFNLPSTAEAFLASIDVLVLDLGKLHGTPPLVEWTRIIDNFGVFVAPPNSDQTLLAVAQNDYQGILFYHAYRGALKTCQFVAILIAEAS